MYYTHIRSILLAGSFVFFSLMVKRLIITKVCETALNLKYSDFEAFYFSLSITFFLQSYNCSNIFISLVNIYIFFSKNDHQPALNKANSEDTQFSSRWGLYICTAPHSQLLQIMQQHLAKRKTPVQEMARCSLVGSFTFAMAMIYKNGQCTSQKRHHIKIAVHYLCLYRINARANIDWEQRDYAHSRYECTMHHLSSSLCVAKPT